MSQSIFGGNTAYPGITLERLRAQAQHVGLVVQAADEWSGVVRFVDVTTLVRYFARVPWEVPDDFTVDRYGDCLLALHAPGGDIQVTQRRFYLICRR